jgi:uncharacterized membrane protein/gas vesicle protein
MGTAVAPCILDTWQKAVFRRAGSLLGLERKQRECVMGKLNALLTGAIVGAGAVYFLDPRLGRQRRKLAGDQMIRLSRRAARGIDAAMRDISNRSQGIAAELGSLVTPHDVSDDVLCEHIRSVAGRYVSNPSALEVDVCDGCVELCGPVLRDEASGLVRAVGSIRGVRGVNNRLQLHESRGNISALQGTGRRRGESTFDVLQSNWAPGTRLIALGGGTLLMANGLLCRTPGSMLLGTLGLGLLARALANMDTGRTFGVTGGQRAININKTIEIAAPAEKVFDFFSTPENYLRISDIVTDARSLGGGRFTKEMTIGGIPFHFEERFTRTQQGELLESRSEPGSALQYMKQLRFERVGNDRTRLHILFSYNPPGGVVAHAVASVLGFDPKTLLDDLMMRAKIFLETGREPHDATGRRRQVADQGGRASPSVQGERQFPRGPGAPSGDVHTASRGEEPTSPWPPAASPTPQSEEIAGRFPPAI